MHLADYLYGSFWTIFFICLVCGPLERGFGSTWGHNFYMSMQNGYGLLIHTLELNVCIGSHAFAIFAHKNYGCVGYVDDHCLYGLSFLAL